MKTFLGMNHPTFLFRSALVTALLITALFIVGALTQTNFFIVLIAALGIGIAMGIATDKVFRKMVQ